MPQGLVADVYALMLVPRRLRLSESKEKHEVFGARAMPHVFRMKLFVAYAAQVKLHTDKFAL